MREIAEDLARPFFDALAQAFTDWLNNWLTDGQAQAVIVENGRSVARYGPRMVIACWGCIAISTAFTLLTLIAAPGSAKWFASPFVFMLAASVLALLDSLIVRIEFNRDELFNRTVWHGRRLIPWSSVETLCYSWLGYRKIYAGDYGKIVISNYLAGSQALVDLVRAKLLERTTSVRLCGSI
jgi:hypothetical protein